MDSDRLSLTSLLPTAPVTREPFGPQVDRPTTATRDIDRPESVLGRDDVELGIHVHLAVIPRHVADVDEDVLRLVDTRRRNDPVSGVAIVVTNGPASALGNDCPTLCRQTVSPPTSSPRQRWGADMTISVVVL